MLNCTQGVENKLQYMNKQIDICDKLFEEADTEADTDMFWICYWLYHLKLVLTPDPYQYLHLPLLFYLCVR